MKRNKNLCLLILIVLFSLTVQANTDLSIGQNQNGELEEDKYAFYTLTIPAGTQKDKMNLIITVEGKDCDKVTEKCTDFSDPDVYVSTVIEQPKDYFNSTWAGQTYGDDIVSISSDNVVEGKQFYIGIYCQYKCKYVLKAELKEIIEVKDGESYRYTVPKASSLYLRFKSKSDYQELMMSFMSFQMKSYKVFVSNTTPSSSNTFKLHPSWISGYVLNIHKGTPEYHADSYYNILIQASETNVGVRVYIGYPETEYTLTSTEGALNSVEQKKSRCYSFPLIRYKNEKLIINLMLFSGTAILRIGGFKSITSLTYDQIPKDNNTYDVTSEKLIILTSQDIAQMKKESNESQNLHFCIYGKSVTSFRVKAHYDTQVEALQRYNFHLVGTSSYGYLPSNQVTKYRLIEFTTDSNLTITLDSIEGEPRLFAYYSDKLPRKFFNATTLSKELERKDSVIMESEEIFSGFEIVINHADNFCHQKPKETHQHHYFSCTVYAVISCEGNDNCIYRLRTNNNKEKKNLIPRTSLYNILPHNQSDFYSIEIEDKDLTLLTVVLNTISGETTLQVNYTSYDLNNPVTDSYYSNNRGYLPNVINVTPNRIKSNTITGSYVFEVHARTFSTYSIYYYTHSKDFDYTKPDWSSVTLKLENGQIIQEIFQKDFEYKIYSYTNNAVKDSDIFITLTRRNVHCVFYVFLDLSTLKYNKDPYKYDKIEGFDWRSGWDNELIISKTDEKYSRKGTYYIVVSRFMAKTDPVFDGVDSFNLGVTNEETDFILYEGVQHSATLKESYKGQGYWYTLESTDKPFSLAVNTNYGFVNVYIDFKRITPERITKDKSLIYYVNEDLSSDFITIKEDDLKKNCSRKSKKCPLSIYIESKSSLASQYIIIAKSGKTRMEYLTSGVIVPNTLQVKESQYFIIEEYGKDRQGSVYVHFKVGNGRVYLKLTEKLFVNEEDFPNATHHQYEGEDDYHGQLISIPKSALDKCNPCKYLVTVTGEQLDYMSSAIQYTILYSDLLQKLILNVPTFDIITSGILQYYQFRIGPEAKNVYLTLYNMKGDAELYLNYGEEKPDFTRHHWHSINPSHDFIDLNINDNYFITNGLKTLEGIYTVCVYAYVNTTYSIYVTDHQNKILPINSNKPGSCQCAAKGDKCHFKMDRIIARYYEIDDVTVVFSTNFNYGSGNIYANLYNETNFGTITKFPTKENYDYSNLDKNKKNFLKIDIKKDNPKLTKQSTLLLTVDCLEKSMFDINAAKLTNATIHGLDIARENIFYLKKYSVSNANTTKLAFYNYQESDINFEIYSYTGRGDIRVYQNVSTYDSKTGLYQYEYKHIAQFEIEPTTSYYNTIRNYNKIMHKYIYFEVTPRTDFGFYVKLNYDQELTMIKIGRIDSFVISHDVFYGYFDLLDDYKEVVLNVRCENPKTLATVSKKLNYISKDKKKAADHKIEYPDENTRDAVTTNALLSSVSIKIDQVDESIRKDKFVRVVFSVRLQSFHYNANYTSANSKVINILVSPEVNYYKRIAAKPLALYFGNQKVDNSDNDTTIFDITKLKKTDDVIVIELSPCDGDIDFRLTNEISYFSTDREGKSVQYQKTVDNGKIKVAIENSTTDAYYMNIWGVKLPGSCVTPADCKTIEYLMYYYTTTKENYGKLIKSNAFSYEDLGKGKVMLELPEIISRGVYQNIVDYSSLTFDVFVTTNQTHFSKMESLCYLSKYEEQFKRVNYLYSSKTNKLEVSGLNIKENCFINVRIMDSKTGEMYTLRPVQINFRAFKRSLPTWVVVLIIIGLITVTGLLFYYFKKYKATKDLLQYEMNDVRNQGQVPKSEAELRDLSQKQKNMKYVPLSEDA